MIELKNLTYYYDKPQGKQPAQAALNNVTAVIEPGIHLMLGENGAGKTTLLRNIAGILQPSSGECLVNGVNTTRRIPSEESSIIYYGNHTTTFFRDIRTMARCHACFYPRFDAEILHRNLETFGIDERQKLSSMSMGTRHKALLCYMLSLNTDILLLDEPTNGLDIESKDMLIKMIAGSLNEWNTIIVSTHTVSDLASLYDGLMVLQGGHLRLASSNDNLMERLAFVNTSSEIPGTLYAEWQLGRLHSILPVETAEEYDLMSGNVDYQLLYKAMHSTAAQEVMDIINRPVNHTKPFES